MKILQINKYFHSMGGVERYMFDLDTLLTKKGHKLAYFSMKDAECRESPWNKYFVSSVEFANTSVLNGLKLVNRMIYSREARSKIGQLLDAFKPDIAHLHGMYHQLSPSIIPEIKKRGIPIIQNLGDYHIISPNYILFHGGKICEITKKNRYYNAIIHKCVKNSRLASCAEVAEKYIHGMWGWERNDIDCFVVPSLFQKNKLVEYGLPGEKIVVLPHFTFLPKNPPKFGKGSYVLYFGRLYEEKGVELLLHIFSRLENIPLKIVGDGPMKKQLTKIITEQKLHDVQLIGFQTGRQLDAIIEDARCTILPSQWYEVFGLSIIESFARGKPVIASNIGGIPEIIKDGYNGYVIDPSNIDHFRKKILYLWENSKICQKFGHNALKTAQTDYNPENHYKKLYSIYTNTIRKNPR